MFVELNRKTWPNATFLGQLLQYHLSFGETSLQGILVLWTSQASHTINLLLDKDQFQILNNSLITLVELCSESLHIF